MWQNADSHPEYTMLMSLVLDDEATAAEELRLRAHVATCESCARTWQRWQELDRRFMAAPVLPAPIDFSAVVAARLDERLVEHSRRRWFVLGLSLSWVVALLAGIALLGIANGWVLPLLPDSGPLYAAWSGLASMGGWIVRAAVSFVEQTGTPTLAAGAGVLLCVTCALATVWLWMVARLTPVRQGSLVASD